MRPEEELRDEETLRKSVEGSKETMLIFGMLLLILMIAAGYYYAEWAWSAFSLTILFTLVFAGGFAWFFWKWWILNSILRGLRFAKGPSIFKPRPIISPVSEKRRPEVKIEWEKRKKRK